MLNVARGFIVLFREIAFGFFDKKDCGKVVDMLRMFKGFGEVEVVGCIDGVDLF